jgi:dTDP-4-amino-4,6-dideoxygalactose transaminase
MPPDIPFNKPFIVGKELHYIAQAITAGRLAGDGYFTQRCCRLLEEQLGIRKVLMTPSCTAALEMAAMLYDLRSGDEVILPSFTFVSTANAFVRLGAQPVFVEIRPDTLNLDEDLIEAAITPHTKAIFPVHYAGVSCAMDRIMAIATRHNLLVVEDAAQGVNAFYKGRALGAIGHLGTYSFHDTKNYTSGEGGALCINAPEMIARAEIIRDKGTNRHQFLRGEVDKYTWVDIGSSYIPSEICCAFLYAQLEALKAIAERRRVIYNIYQHHLQPLEEQGLLRLPHIPHDCASNYHSFHIVLNDLGTRNALMAYLHQHGIQAVFHYIPLHSSPIGKKFGYCASDLPITEELSGRLLRLPCYCDLAVEEQLRIVQHIINFLTHGGGPARKRW